MKVLVLHSGYYVFSDNPRWGLWKESLPVLFTFSNEQTACISL